MAYEDMTKEELILELRKRDSINEIKINSPCKMSSFERSQGRDIHRELYKKFINTLPEGVFIYKDGKIIDANKKGLNLIKCEDIEKIKESGLGCMVMVHPDYDNEVVKRRDALNGRETHVEPMEQIVVLRDGSQMEVEVSGFSFDYEGDHYIVSILRDIRAKKMFDEMERRIIEKMSLLEESKKYNALKTQLFAIISHELKTPLNIIYGTVQLLEKLYGGGQGGHLQSFPKYLKIMKQNCNRLLKMINNFIDMNRIEVGFFNINLENCDIVKIIEDITLSIIEYSDGKNINVIFDTEVEEKITACDQDKLERIMLNLLSNAIKFTEPGGEVRVNIYDRNSKIVISVKDTGIGIPNEMQERIFDNFMQVDSYLRRRAEGSGIGLSLVKSLVEMHDGSINVKSEYGVGSEFLIELPLRLVEDYEDSSKNEIAAACDKIERVNIEFSDVY